MELRHLRYFSAVAESSNMSKASSLVNITQPALSRQIKDLEDELGVALFSRHSSGMKLTEGGQVFLRSSKKILAFAAAAVREANTVGKQLDIEFKVGFDYDSISVSMFQALSDFGLNNLAVKLSLVELPPRTLLEHLRTGALDMAITETGVVDLTEEFEELVMQKKRLQILLNAQHKLASCSQVDLASLADEPLIVLRDKLIGNSKIRAIKACRRSGFEPPIVIECNTYAAMLGFVAAGRGYCLHPNNGDFSLYKSVVRIVPALQVWEVPGSSLLWLRSTESHIRDLFVQSFTEMHRSGVPPTIFTD